MDNQDDDLEQDYGFEYLPQDSVTARVDDLIKLSDAHQRSGPEFRPCIREAAHCIVADLQMQLTREEITIAPPLKLVKD